LGGKQSNGAGALALWPCRLLKRIAMPFTRKRATSQLVARCMLGACALLAAGLAPADAHAATPQIRTSARNVVPACVTPERLMQFLKSRNSRLDKRYADIASWYKHHGEAWNVRWDYAFFQMAVETNFLTYRRGNGDWGDVNPRQNNFAGLGTTGGGVPGDSYPDVPTGVLAQIQHLVVYSGQRIPEPVGARTRLKQDDIIETMARFKGRATFDDLSRRWAADRRYGANIEWVAGNYRAAYCNGRSAQAEPRETPLRPAAPVLLRAGLGGPVRFTRVADAAPVRTIWSRSAQDVPAPTPAAEPDPQRTAEPPRAAPSPTPPVKAQRPAPTKPAAVPAPVAAQPAVGTPAPSSPASAAPAAPPAADPRAFTFAASMNAVTMKEIPVPQPVTGAEAAQCRVLAASYGGEKTLLVRSEAGGALRYIALTVLEGFEGSMLENFIKEQAPGGESVGTFATKDLAVAKARELCSGAAQTAPAKRANAG
jgi:hypothetical protein